MLSYKRAAEPTQGRLGRRAYPGGLTATPSRRSGFAIGLALAASGLVGVVAACSNEPNASQLGGCTSFNGVPCVTPVRPGATPSNDAGAPRPIVVVLDAGNAALDARVCPGAAQIFTTPGSSCAACVAQNCCEGPTSCPNDPACVSIAACVVTICLANDVSCLPTCEGAAPTGTVTEFINFQQCVGQACPGCPLLAAAVL
jgi:hypothetical protein